MSQTSHRHWAAILITAQLGAACAAELDRQPLSALELRLTEIEGGTGRIQYTLTNHSDAPLQVLAWRTALHQNPDPLFRIAVAGSEVAYRGPRIVRPAPSAEHYLELGPGESASTAVDLVELYDLREAGRYEVRALPTGAGFVRGDNAPDVLANSTLIVEINPERSARGTPAVGLNTGALMVSECDDAQRQDLERAQDAAYEYAAEAAAHHYIAGHDARAERWFGPYSDARHGVISTIVRGVYYRLEEDPFTYLCNEDFGRGCTDALAVMYPWINNMIQICEAFFDRPTSGQADSQAKIIIHETAHFHAAQDTAHGVDDAKALIRYNPDWAVWNADNYAFYALDPVID